MQVSVLLQRKGSDVVTVAPHLTAAEAVDAMARHRVGAVVVTTDGQPRGELGFDQLVTAAGGNSPAAGGNSPAAGGNSPAAGER